jgi:hypothetical protein
MNVHRRLHALERRRRRADGTLILPGGGRIVIQVSDWLGLTLAAMRRQHARICGQRRLETPFDRTLDLLERAIDVGPFSPPLLEVAWGVLQRSQADDDFESTSTPSTERRNQVKDQPIPVNNHSPFPEGGTHIRGSRRSGSTF